MWTDTQPVTGPPLRSHLYEENKERNPAAIVQTVCRILTVFAICTVSITLYSTYEYSRLQTSFQNKSLEYYSAYLAKTTREAYENYGNICYSTAYSPIVQNYLASDSVQEAYEGYESLKKQLHNATRLSPYIIDVAVCGKDGSFANLYGSSHNYDALLESLPESHFPYCSAGMSMINQTTCHILAIPVYSLDAGDNRYLGVLFLAVDIHHLLENSLEERDTFYNPQILFADDAGHLIYGEQDLYDILCAVPACDTASQIMTLADGSTRYGAIAYQIPDIGHTLYVLTSQSQLTRQVVMISGRLLLGLGVLSALVMILLALLCRPLIRSLHQLTDYMHSISAGNREHMKHGPSIRQGPIGSIEIHQISAAFDEMLTKNNQLVHTILDNYTKMYQLEVSNRKTEIAFLRSQINPHFLYNTLSMICGMAAEGITDKIISITNALSQIFRYSIKGSELVTLRREMEIVRSYLMIQDERFDGRFRVCYQLSEDSLDCLIPKMIIQPLVENAIVHGLEKSARPGQLLIEAGRESGSGDLTVRIHDTGIGISKDRLENLRSTIRASVCLKSEGSIPPFPGQAPQEVPESIGILNVNSRMVLYYGSAYVLQLDSEEGVGTCVRLRIPYCTHNTREYQGPDQPGKEPATCTRPSL